MSSEARIEATAGLQMSQPAAGAVAGDDLVERAVPVHRDDVEQLLPGQPEVLAEAAVHDLADGLEVVLDDLLDQRLAGAAGRCRPGCTP